MTTPAEPPQRRKPPVSFYAGILVVILAVGWLMLRMYTSAASRECYSGYHAARTAADTARVDSLVPDPKDPVAHTCGWIRSSARWR
jgi:hypothetical protein